MKKINVKKYTLELVLAAILIAAIVPIVFDTVNRFQSKGKPQGMRVEISMSGFSPATIRAKAGEKITIQMVNPDNSQHSDGGGWHQFASAELKFDYKLPPESTKTIQLKIDKPGEYDFYCDTCCGGKENPSMQGKLIIT